MGMRTLLSGWPRSSPVALSRQEHDNLTETTLVRKRTQAEQRSDATGSGVGPRTGGRPDGQQVLASIRKNSLAIRPPNPGYAPPPVLNPTRTDNPPVGMPPVNDGYANPKLSQTIYWRGNPPNPNSEGYPPSPQRPQQRLPPQASGPSKQRKRLPPTTVTTRRRRASPSVHPTPTTATFTPSATATYLPASSRERPRIPLPTRIGLRTGCASPAAAAWPRTRRARRAGRTRATHAAAHVEWTWPQALWLATPAVLWAWAWSPAWCLRPASEAPRT